MHKWMANTHTPTVHSGGVGDTPFVFINIKVSKPLPRPVCKSVQFHLVQNDRIKFMCTSANFVETFS